MTEPTEENTKPTAERLEAVTFYREYPDEFLQFATENYREEMDKILEAFRLDTLEVFVEVIEHHS